MRHFLRLYRAEWYKMRHTIIPALHICVPLAGSLVFLLYYRARPWNGAVQLSGFVQVVGMAFPLLVSLIVSRSVGLEEANHYQIFLGGNAGRISSLLAKCIALQTAGLGAVILGVGSFALGEMFLLGNYDVPGVTYFSSAAGLWIGSLTLYPIHFFFSMRFSKSVSVAIGTAQAVLAGLLITGLGEGVWQFVPCSWSIRLTSISLVNTVFAWQESNGTVSDMQLLKENVFSIFMNEMGYICLLISLGICVIIFIWFRLRSDYVASAHSQD